VLVVVSVVASDGVEVCGGSSSSCGHVAHVVGMDSRLLDTVVHQSHLGTFSIHVNDSKHPGRE